MYDTEEHALLPPEPTIDRREQDGRSVRRSDTCVDFIDGREAPETEEPDGSRVHLIE